MIIAISSQKSGYLAHLKQSVQIFSDRVAELFSNVVAIAEKAGKHVELLVVPGRDYNRAAVEVARCNFDGDPDTLVIQGDILHPPFRADSFDGGFTIGVLHHTPDPSAGLTALTGRQGPLSA